MILLPSKKGQFSVKDTWEALGEVLFLGLFSSGFRGIFRNGPLFVGWIA